MLLDVARVVLPAVVVQVEEQRCALVKGERVVLLRSLSSVPPSFWPIPVTEYLPCVLYEYPPCFSACYRLGGVAARYLFW